MADAEICVASKRLDIAVPSDSPAFLKALPTRSGARPETNPCLPHYQKTDNPSKAVWEALIKRVFSEQNTNFPGSTGPHRSLVSLPDSQALFLDGDPSVPCARAFIGKEWAHIHGASDGSAHVGLSEADAATAIKAGWAERHLLAGKNGLVAGLVMIYAPRNDEEINVVLEILQAAYKFARGDLKP